MLYKVNTRDIKAIYLSLKDVTINIYLYQVYMI